MAFKGHRSHICTFNSVTDDWNVVAIYLVPMCRVLQFSYMSSYLLTYLTSLAVIPSLTRGTVTWPDVCDNVIRVSLHCGESVVNWPFAAICRLSSVLAITRRSIDTVSCSNHCQLMCSRKCSLFLLFRGCDANVQSCRVRLCKIMNTSIYYVFITTRSYFVTPMPVRPSCSPLDGDERHDHPLLHVSPGSSMSRSYCTVFGTETQLELYRQGG